MKLKSTLLALVAIALACVAFLAPQAFPPAFIVAGIAAALIAQPSAPTRRVAVNGLEGTHAGSVGYLTDEAMSLRYLFAKRGSDSDHIGIADKGDLAIGLVPDEVAAAEVGERRTLKLLRPTDRCVAGGTIAVDDELLQTDDGKVIAFSSVAAAGTYTWVGRALTAASSGAQLEFLPRDFIKVQFIANGSTLGATQAAMNGLKIVIVLGS